MAKQSVDQINAVVRSCGLAPKKAQAIRDLSTILLKEYDCQVPASFDDLENYLSWTQNSIRSYVSGIWSSGLSC